VTTPEPRPGSTPGSHEELDERLAEAFRRYDEAFRSRRAAPQANLVAARMDLSLLLWDGEDAPPQVQEQLAADGQDLMRDTPPL
jgi:hypothetical protein